MSTRPISIQPVQGGQLGLGGLTATTSALTSLTNQQLAQDEAMKRAILGQVGSGIREKLQRDAELPVELRLQEMRLPGQLLQQAGNVFNAAKVAGDTGDFARQKQLNDLGQSIVSGAFGGGLSIPQSTPSPSTGLPTTSTGQDIPFGGEFMTPSGQASPGQSLIPQGQDTSIKQPSPAVDAASFDVTPPPVLGVDPSSVSNLPLSAQEKIGKIQKQRSEAATNQVKLGVIDSFEQVKNAPDGTMVTGLGGQAFKDIEVTPGSRALSKLAQRRAAVNPAKFNDLGETNRTQAKTVFDVLIAAKQIEPIVGEGGIDAAKRNLIAGDQLPDFLPFGGAIDAFISESVVSGSKDRESLSLAQAADDKIGAELSPILKGLFSESGNLSDGDIKRASGAVPRLTDKNIRVFKNKMKNFAQATLPRIMDAAFMTGDETTFNQAQSVYETIFNKPYKINSKSSFEGNFFRDTNGRTFNVQGNDNTQGLDRGSLKGRSTAELQQLLGE